MSLAGAYPVTGRWLAAAILAVFPLGGLAVFLGIRVGNTYRVWGSAQWVLFSERSPKWLTRVAMGTFLYSLVRFIAFAVTRSQQTGPEARMPMGDVSAFIGAFYVGFLVIFTAGLRDDRLAPNSRRSRREPSRPNS